MKTLFMVPVIITRNVFHFVKDVFKHNAPLSTKIESIFMVLLQPLIWVLYPLVILWCMLFATGRKQISEDVKKFVNEQE